MSTPRSNTRPCTGSMSPFAPRVTQTPINVPPTITTQLSASLPFLRSTCLRTTYATKLHNHAMHTRQLAHPRRQSRNDGHSIITTPQRITTKKILQTEFFLQQVCFIELNKLFDCKSESRAHQNETTKGTRHARYSRPHPADPPFLFRPPNCPEYIPGSTDGHCRYHLRTTALPYLPASP